MVRSATTGRAGKAGAFTATAVGVVLLMLALHAGAATAPALPGNGPGSLPARLAWPADATTPGGVVRCQVTVATGGQLRGLQCFEDARVEPAFVAATLAAADGAVFVPARRDATAIEVEMRFAVLFRKVDGVPVMAVVPHHLEHFDAWGLAYVAPQRLPGRTGNWCTVPRECLRGYRVWTDAEIGADGVPRAFAIRAPSGVPREIRNNLERIVLGWRYVAGRVDGEPRAMSVIEPFAAAPTLPADQVMQGRATATGGQAIPP